MKVEEESRSRESFFMRSVSGPKCIYNLQFYNSPRIKYVPHLFCMHVTTILIRGHFLSLEFHAPAVLVSDHSDRNEERN